MGIETGMMLFGAGMSAYGAYNSSQQTKNAYNAQGQVAENNAKIAEWQAQDAVRRGDVAASRQGIRTNQVKGAQRAALAANGVDLGVGTALNIVSDTDYFGQVDRATILDTAAREAWGYRTQGANYDANASLLRSRADAESPLMAGATSFLTSATKVAGTWYKTGGAASGPTPQFQPGSGWTPVGNSDGLSQGDRRKLGVY
jgi:transposase InsO family protein